MSSDTFYVYAGACPCCGHIVAVAVDNPDHAKETAKDVAAWVRDGLQVTRRLWDADAQSLFKTCAAKAKKEAAKAAQLSLEVTR